MKEKNEKQQEFTQQEMNGESMTEPNVNDETSLISIPETPRAIDIDKEIDRVEKNIEYFNKIKLTSLKLTKPTDWVMQKDSPYLMDRGAENIAIAWGVDISDVKLKQEWAEDEKGRYYSFVASGKAYAKRLGRYVEDIGVCSQRDRFFGMVSGELKPIEEVDMANIRRKAITNLHTRLIKRVVGILNVTIDDLKEIGFDISKIKKIEYKEGAKKTQQTVSESDKTKQKEIWNMLIQHTGGNDELAKEVLKKESSFFSKKENKKIEGKNDVKYLTGKWLDITHNKIKKLIEERMPGEEG